MRTIKKTLVLLFCLFFIFPFTSCSKGNFICEYSLKKQLVDITLDQFKEKVNSNDNLIVYINSSSCPVCQYAKDNFLLDYIKETALKIYSFEPPLDLVNESEKFIESISSSSARYLKYNNDDLSITIPTILLISEGKVVKYANGYGYKDISKNFFSKNVKNSYNKISISIKEEEKLILEKVDNPSFIYSDEGVTKGIIYYTNTNEINGEMKYYLKPFIEDFNTNIYVKVDSSYTKNKLEVKINDKIFSTSNVDKYLSLLEKTTIR